MKVLKKILQRKMVKIDANQWYQLLSVYSQLISDLMLVGPNVSRT